MARVDIELPNDELKAITDRDESVDDVMNAMLQAAGNVALNSARSNAQRAFKTPGRIVAGLKLTRPYKNSDGGRSIKVGFYGYHSGRKTKKYPAGVPIALIASAREYGTSSGETAKPFFRKAFKQKGAIDAAMQGAHDKYIKD